MDTYHVRAFAIQKTGGNPAGVVLGGSHLKEEDMLKIAGHIGYSETAFVFDSDLADFKVRFFTPTDEVDLCGHATIATFALLKTLNFVGDGLYTQETKAGVLKVKLIGDLVMMDQLIPTFYDCLDSKIIASSLGIPESSILSPVQVVSTGLKDIIIQVESLEALQNIQADYVQISEISKTVDAVGYHVFTLETIENSQAHCRNFAPLYGIDEEAATGTASGALAAYINQYKLLPMTQGENTLIFEQGYSMDSPSQITVKMDLHEEKVQKISVGGRAVISKPL